MELTPPPQSLDSRSPHDTFSVVQHVLDRLAERRAPLIDAVTAHCGYSKSDANALVCDIDIFLGSLVDLIANHARLLEVENSLIASLSPSAELCLLPWGRVLFVVPGNAPAPLAVIVPLALALAGNSVTVAGNRNAQPVI